MKHSLVIVSFVCLNLLMGFSIGLGQDDNLIVPGERIGPIRSGAFVQDILREVGKPDRTVKWKDGAGVNYIYDRIGIWFTVKTLDEIAPTVGEVFTEDSRYATGEGIHVGSSGVDVARAYGRGDCSSYGGNVSCFYRGLFVSVQINSNKVIQISVRR